MIVAVPRFGPRAFEVKCPCGHIRRVLADSREQAVKRNAYKSCPRCGAKILP